MKSLLTSFLALSLSFVGIAQNTDIQNHTDSKVLFRGFENVLSELDFGLNPKDFELRAVDNVVVKINDVGDIIAYPGANKTARIAVYDGEKHIKTIDFAVTNRPVNVLYFCGQESGQEIAAPCSSIHVDLPKEAAHRPSNNVVNSWELIIPGAEFGSRGTGSEIPIFLEVFEKLDSGQTIVVTVMYSDSQGIQRKAEGRWTVKK